MTGYHLAQTNLGRVRAPLDSPELQPFMDALVGVNANADAAPGFVWRLQTEEGDAPARRRREFFEKIELVNALWWVPAGHVGFQRHFPPPDATSAPLSEPA